MNELVKQLSIRLVESTVALEVAAAILISRGYPKTSESIKEIADRNTKLLEDIKKSVQE